MRNTNNFFRTLLMSAGILVQVLATQGCVKTSQRDNDRSPQSDVVSVSADDKAMNAAMERGKATLPEFEAIVRAPRAGQSDFCVKAAFPTKDNVEYIWLADPQFQPDSVTGIVNNDPEAVPNLKLGQQVTVKRSSVSDWTYIENGILKGGFTIRYFMDKLPPAERAQQLQAMGIRLE